MDGMYNRSRKATFSNFSVQSSEVYTAAEIIHYFSVKIAVSLPIKHEILRLTTFANTEKRMENTACSGVMLMNFLFGFRSIPKEDIMSSVAFFVYLISALLSLQLPCEAREDASNTEVG